MNAINLEGRRKRLVHAVRRGLPGGRPTKDQAAAIKRAVELEEIARLARQKALAGEIPPASVYVAELTANRALAEVMGMAAPPPKVPSPGKLLRELR